jgi:hypothetical protein
LRLDAKESRAVEAMVADWDANSRLSERAEEVLEITTSIHSLRGISACQGTWLARPHWDAFDRLLLIRDDRGSTNAAKPGNLA